MVFFKPTTLEKVTVSIYNSFSKRSAIIKEYNRVGHVDNIKHLPALLNYKVNLTEDTWVTSGFLLARYGPFEVFVRLAPEILSSQLSSDGFTLLFAIASSEANTAFSRLTQFFKQFTRFDINEPDQFGRCPLHYVRCPAVYRLLVEHGAIADKPEMMHPFEYMTATGNKTVFSLANDFKPLVKTLLQHGTTNINFALTVLSRVRGNAEDETLRAVHAHFGMLNLFSQKANLFFRKAGNVPTDHYITLFDYCCEYLKDKSPGRLQLVIAAINLKDNIGLLGEAMSVIQANALRHHAYMRLARIVLEEEPMAWYSFECGLALSSKDVKRFCTRAYRSERLEISKLMVEAHVPHLPNKLEWCIDWISTAYELEIDLGGGEEGKEEYYPIIRRLARMKNEYEQSALHIMCAAFTRDSNFEFFKLLVDMGAELDSRDCDGYTPLFQLVETYRVYFESSAQVKVKMAELLLARGAHVDVPDKKRKVNVSNKLGEMINRTFMPSLKCLCARKLQDNRQNMNKKLKVLPQQIRDFVDIH